MVVVNETVASVTSGQPHSYLLQMVAKLMGTCIASMNISIDQVDLIADGTRHWWNYYYYCLYVCVVSDHSCKVFFLLPPSLILYMV